jgi:predicted metal-dependent HD superfamily phosphohydrolase
MENIYKANYFSEKFENVAKENLRRELELL